ncbi:inositol oxygenase-like isoform X1 [Eriocheir sinensis]|uniref:inositol oxygenase-like isoform X1 n=1 Tax=Eriocheir sinensis TaxID=95602 RepID=UPI0021C88A94|nr:inositol oxygenase-like isoform X1 [Eriocheir sinensis]
MERRRGALQYLRWDPKLSPARIPPEVKAFTMADSKSSTKILMIDPSLVFRPEEAVKESGDWQFRTFDENSTDPQQMMVKNTYLQMHTHQCVDYVKRKHKEWGQFNKFEATIMEALEKLNDLMDESDPDVDVPNHIHAFQTAERLREAHPDKDWLHLTGLLHDLGKVMVFYGEPQWSTVGDTFAVGCEFSPSIVYRNSTFHDNPDLNNPKFNTKYGMYEPNCGLEKVYISWGHDEYMYQVLKHNKCTLPEEAMYIIRFHSFYPWHGSGDYYHLCDNRDMEMLPWIKEFNKFDLYTKKQKIPDMKALQPYYQSLVDKYCPGKLKW